LTAIRQISRFAERVEPVERIEVIIEDPTDNRILECAVASRSEYLVTGDRHLLKIGQFAGTKIVKAASLLELVTPAGSEHQTNALEPGFVLRSFRQHNRTRQMLGTSL
jgi:hypothetical protein